MRHRKRTVKLGRTTSQREALLAHLVCSLITSKRIKTTLPKARAARVQAEKMITLGKKGTLAARRIAIARLKNESCVKELFSSIAPAYKDRQGGYTRIYKLGRRSSDSSEMALLEFVDYSAPKASGGDATEGKKEAGKKSVAKKADSKKDK